MPYFNIVAQTSENTVVTEYEPVKARSDSYQSETELEQEFIRMLTEQGYEYLRIHSEAELIANLRKKLETLNSYTFSDSEWDRFFKDALANPNDHIVEKTRKIQEDFVQVLKRDDGSTKNITLIDKKNIHNNLLQVINQYDDPGKWLPDDPCGAEAARCGYPGGVQSDRPVSAGFLLGWKWSVRVCPDLRDQ